MPELVAVNGLYKTADDLGQKCRNLPVQVSLDGDLSDPHSLGLTNGEN